MKRCICFLIYFVVLMAWSPVSESPAALAREEGKEAWIEKTLKIQIPFILNQGQINDDEVKFYAETFGGTICITKRGELVYSLLKFEEKGKQEAKDKHLGVKGRPSKDPPKREVWTLKESLIGAIPQEPKGLEKALCRVNYFIGNERNKWKTDTPTYNALSLGEVYKGIELELRAYGKNVEKVFTIKPGANVGAIRLKIDGADSLKVNEIGELEIRTKVGIISFTAPVAFQEKDGKKEYLEVAYHLSNDTYGFKITDYDRSRPLIIDPLLGYSTYLGGSNYDRAIGIAVDNLGNAYITGQTGSTDFPTLSSIQGRTGQYMAFVAKINASGTLVYSTYLGGSGYYNQGNGIAVDSYGDAYVTGWTTSIDFPTVSPIQAHYGGGGEDAFVTKINASGNALLYSTYLGGSKVEYGDAIAVDTFGNAYITGATVSTDFPTASPIQGIYGGGDCDAFIVKVSASGNSLVYSTYLGGKGADGVGGIAVDSNGNVYVTGSTNSSDFPLVSPIQGGYGGGECDAFISKINPAGSDFVYSTYLGGSAADLGNGVAVDSIGNAYITGSTSSINFPTVSAIQGSNAGGDKDVFVTKINSSGSALVYSTYLGGSDDEQGLAIAVDTLGNAYITGNTRSYNFPIASPIQNNLAGNYDVFVTQLNASGNNLVYSTYLGGSGSDMSIGIAVDPSGNAYVTGYTESNDFLTSSPFQGQNAGYEDAFIAKITEQLGSYTFATDPSGLNVTVDGTTYTTPYSVNWNPGSNHTVSVPSPQSAVPGVRYIWNSWNDAGAQYHTITAPSYNVIYTAYFDIQNGLTTSVNPSGAGIVSPAGTTWYSTNQNVSISATDNSGYTFSNWSGDLAGTANPTFITMNVPKNVTANFTQLAPSQYTLSANVTPPGSGLVSKNPDKPKYSNGEQVTLTATANSGYSFSSWSGDLSSTTNPTIITMNGTKNVTANFIYSPPIMLQSPFDGTHFAACSLYSLPAFSWSVMEAFKGYEIQFSLDSNFISPIKVRASRTQSSITSATWKKVLLLSGNDGGTVYWKVIGTRAYKIQVISNVFSILIEGAHEVENPQISPTGKSSLPTLSWTNHCNMKFKVWFGNDSQFSKKKSFSFNLKNLSETFTKDLTPSQWSSIRKLVGDATGETIYWRVESWDGLKRNSKTDVMSFVLTD